MAKPFVAPGLKYWLLAVLGVQVSEHASYGVSQKHGYLFGGPHNKDYSVFGSILGVPLNWETTI